MVMRFNDVFYSFLECDDDELEEYITIDKYNSCPCCNVVNSPTIKGLIEYPIYETKLVDMNEGKINVFSEGTYKAELIEREVLVGKKTDVVYQCSSSKCQRIFIVHYQTEKEYGEIKNTIIDTISPFSTADVSVSENINEICERYYEIYRQAYLAEMMGLTEICGMGYRKALEFLVKDYVIYLNKDNAEFSKEKLQSKLLGQVISNDIKSGRVQELAKRAAWLGNDETHYLRKWIDKDIEHLKEIIKILVYEIEMELAYRKTIASMPTGK